jgi:hypothetical protein
LTVDADETLTTLTVRATSTFDGTKSATATVTVTGFVASGFDVWLIGAAPPVTYAMPPSANNVAQNAMTDAGSGVFTWTGTLKTGVIQFISNRNGTPNWNSPCGDWFTRNTTTSITLGTAQAVEVNQGQKNGWTVATAGNYTITLNTNTTGDGALTVLFVQN